MLNIKSKINQLNFVKVCFCIITILILWVIQVQAQQSEPPVSISGNNITLSQVFQQIEKQTGLTIFYNSQLLNDNDKVDINFKGAVWNQVLTYVLKGRNISFELKREKIVVLNKVNQTSVAPIQQLPQQPQLLRVKVVDEENKESLVGVAITVKNAPKKTTQTNAEGFFSIRANNNEILLLSYIGYITKEIKVSEIKEGTIGLKSNPAILDQVVVIGYGSVKRDELTGSVGEVSMDDLRKAPVASFEQALAGRIAGVQVSSNEGQPGSEMNIVVRGGNSLTQSNSPLYVVDGFPIEDFNVASLNSEDIASISILKDASATAIYGSRAANGVIIIETKQGTAGRPTISYNGYGGVQHIIKTIELMDSYEFVRYMIERDPVDLYNKYITSPGFTLEDYRNRPTIDWQEQLFKPAFMQNHYISLRGGTTQTKYSISASVFDQDGISPNSGFQRYQGRVSLEQSISSKLKATINANFSQDKNYGALTSQQGSSDNSYATYLMYQTWANRPVIPEGQENIFDNLFIDGEDEDENVRLMNPIVAARNQIRQQTRNNLTVNGRLDYTIGKGVSFMARGGVNRRFTKNESFFNSKTYQGYPFANNVRGVNGNYNQMELTDWSNEETLSYQVRPVKNHVLNALIGVSMQGTSFDRYGFGVNRIIREDMGLAGLRFGEPTAIVSQRSRNMILSYLSRINYNIKGRYLFTASMRADGSSKFSKENRWGYFPSGDFAWHLGKEPFMRSLKFISTAKFRVSYGTTGNNRVGDFSRYSAIDVFSDFYSFDNGIPSHAAMLNNLGWQGLKWETTSQANLGLDLSFFKERANLTIDIYRKVTRDLLLDADLPGTSGFTSMYRNIGKIRNDGLEIALNTQNIKNRNFSWGSSFNISFNRNKVMALTFGQETLFSRVNWTNAFNPSSLYVAQVGAPAANFIGYIWDGNYQYSDFTQNLDGSYTLKNSVPTNGFARDQIKPGDIKYKDLNGDMIVNNQDRVVIGRALPVHTGGFGNNFRYKGFDLNVLLQWSYGNDIFNANRLAFEGNFGNRNINQFATYAGRWTEENQNNEYFRSGGQGPNGMYSTRTIEDGSYLRLKTVQLSYSLPKPFTARLGIKNMSVYTAGQDLLTLTGYSGIDPEVSVRNSTLTPGFDYSAYPRVRTFTFGIRAEL